MSDTLKMLPKYEEYIVYMNNVLITSPKICRANIGDELRKTMYKTLLYIYKLIYVENKFKLNICNELDALFAYQRALIRSMYELKYIDMKKKINSIKMLGEIGKMLGGYVKSIGVNYAKNV